MKISKMGFRMVLGLIAISAVTVFAFGTRGFADEKKPKILYFDLSTEWEHPPTVNEADGTSLAAKKVKAIGEKLGMEVVCSKDGTIFDEDLSSYSAFVFYTCGDLDKMEKPTAEKKPISDAGRANLLAAIRGGTGFLGIHSATDTWQCGGELWENQPEATRTDYIKMIGGDFITHGQIQEATLGLTDPVELPSLKALDAKSLRFTDEWYTMKNFNPDIHVILYQVTDTMKKDGPNRCYNRPIYPSTWARMEEKGRVAYTAFGHGNEMWEAPLVLSVVSDLMEFVTGRINLDLTPNLDKVCPNASVLQN